MMIKLKLTVEEIHVYTSKKKRHTQCVTQLVDKKHQSSKMSLGGAF